MAGGQAISKIIGKFVNDNQLGPAKIVGIENGRYKLEYFYSSTNRKFGWVTSDKTHPIRLSAQTRVYVEENGWWRCGRVRKVHLRVDKGCDYDIEFPTQQRGRYAEENLYCRCWGPHDDPTGSLSTSGGEAQSWHEHRQKFLTVLLEQRAACRGLTSLLSSRIELVPHQIEVARRVLEDPLQRYLLADEVGMGKTIEAGIITRQYLLANPKGAPVWIFVPERLVNQWKRELVRKFAIDEFPERVKVLNVDQLRFPPHEMPGLVVIDEAHHVIASQDPPQGLLQLASWAPRLLLLSATPALGQADVLLRLLRIIDPDNYDKITLETFQGHIDKRETIGIFLRGLRGDASPAVLRQRLRNLSSLFPDDQVATRTAAEISDAMVQGDVGKIRLLTNTLRSHIADVHRIHQRLIRTRRRDAADWVFRPRGPAVTVDGEVKLDHVRLTWIKDSRMAALADMFEQWRIQTASEQQGRENSQRSQCVNWMVALFEAISCGSHRLETALSDVPDCVLSDEWKSGFRNVLKEENKEALREEQVAAQIQHYLQLLSTQGDSMRPKIVVFGSDESDVERCAQYTAALLGKTRVMLGWDAGDDVDISLSFYDRADAQVLFCSREGEEGLNLHFADAVVHLDLPLSPTRIEQRIGRIDRFGRRADVVPQSIVLPAVPKETSVWHAWYEMLGDGFQIFNNPVTDVQFSLEAINHELSAALFASGVVGLRERIGCVRTRLDDERERLDNQHALDRVLQEEVSGSLINRLEHLEAKEEQIISATRGWLLQALSFECKGELEGVCRIEWDMESTQLPAWPWGQVFKSGLEGKHTFRRSLATRQRMGPQPQLMRLGSVLMRALEQEFRWDDRGTAFATWRQVETPVAGEWIGYKLCYTVEARLPYDLRPEERNAIAARADGYLAPWVETLYIDAELQIVSESELLKILEEPYKKGRDTNIGGGLEILDALLGQRKFDQLCREVREYSESWLRGTEAYQQVVAEAVEYGTLDIQRRLSRLEQRRAFRSRQGEGVENGIEREIALNSSLLRALANPLVKLDAIGLYVVSNRSPAEFLSEV